MATTAFPSLVPRQRSISAGAAPVKDFIPASGHLYRQGFGNRPQPIDLTLSWPNVPDDWVAQVLNHYRDCGIERFTIDRPTLLKGVAAGTILPTGNLRFFYASAPTFQSVRPGYSSLSVRLAAAFSPAAVGTIAEPVAPPVANRADFGPLPAGQTAWTMNGEIIYVTSRRTWGENPTCEVLYTNENLPYAQNVTVTAGYPMQLRFRTEADASCEGLRNVKLQRSHDGGTTWLDFGYGNQMAWSGCDIYTAKATCWPSDEGMPADPFWLEYDPDGPWLP